MKRAIVLSGGGARGSYEIGVWKALRKLHIKYDIVTGTSVGSLNGALMAQKTYFRGIWFWKNINPTKVFKDDFNSCGDKRTVFKQYAKAILVDSGIDVSNLENTIEKVLNEKKLRRSNIDFGLVTVNLTSLKPLRLTKKDIPIGKLKDYLMASATCFPAFKKKRIDNDDFIDGGYSDNLPINLAIDMGATEVIAVDLRTIGLKRHIKDKNVKVTYIAPRNNFGSFLTFDRDLSRRGIRLGYNDTMKTFKYLDGDKFTFKQYHMNRNFKRYSKIYKRMLDNLFQKKNNSIITQLLKITAYKKELKEKDFEKIIESLGRTFKIDDSYIYDIKDFNSRLLDELEKMPIVDRKLVEQKIKDNDLKNLINNKYVVKYIYDKIIIHNDSKIEKELSSIALLLPKELLGALYLYILRM